MSERGQTIIIIWALIFMAIFGLAWITLLQMVPPPSPALSPEAVAAFYAENSFKIKLGAMIASWVSAPMVPFSVVVAVQMARLETGFPIWSALSFAGGILMSMFLVFPPIIWGVAAFTPERAPELTAMLNELANLTLVTTDQFFIFQMIPITYVALNYPADANTAFPRWLGWFILWVAIAFEVGAIAFMTKTGPFAWDGVIVFWMPFTLFFLWVPLTSIMMLRALKRQRLAAEQTLEQP
jgi:hypothetical protein